MNGWADWDGCPDRRIDAATGQSSTVFDPNVALPQISFEGDQDVLGEEALAQVDAFIALLQLNPWLGRVDLAVSVNVATVKDAEIALAARRKAHLDEQLAARGLSRRRYRFVRPRAVTKGVAQAVHFETADVATGLRPVGSTDAEFTMVMEAAVQEELSRRRAEPSDNSAVAPAPAPTPSEPASEPTSPAEQKPAVQSAGGDNASEAAPSTPPPADATPPAGSPSAPTPANDPRPPDAEADVPQPTAPLFDPPVQRPKIPLPGPPG